MSEERLEEKVDIENPLKFVDVNNSRYVTLVSFAKLLKDGKWYIPLLDAITFSKQSEMLSEESVILKDINNKLREEKDEVYKEVKLQQETINDIKLKYSNLFQMKNITENELEEVKKINEEYKEKLVENFKTIEDLTTINVELRTRIKELEEEVRLLNSTNDDIVQIVTSDNEKDDATFKLNDNKSNKKRKVKGRTSSATKKNSKKD